MPSGAFADTHQSQGKVKGEARRGIGQACRPYLMVDWTRAYLLYTYVAQHAASSSSGLVLLKRQIKKGFTSGRGATRQQPQQPLQLLIDFDKHDNEKQLALSLSLIPLN